MKLVTIGAGGGGGDETVKAAEQLCVRPSLPLPLTENEAGSLGRAVCGTDVDPEKRPLLFTESAPSGTLTPCCTKEIVTVLRGFHLEPLNTTPALGTPA